MLAEQCVRLAFRFTWRYLSVILTRHRDVSCPPQARLLWMSAGFSWTMTWQNHFQYYVHLRACSKLAKRGERTHTFFLTFKSMLIISIQLICVELPFGSVYSSYHFRTDCLWSKIFLIYDIHFTISTSQREFCSKVFCVVERLSEGLVCKGNVLLPAQRMARRLDPILSCPLLWKEQQKSYILWNRLSFLSTTWSLLVLRFGFLDCLIWVSQILCCCLCLFLVKFCSIVVYQINNNSNCSYSVLKTYVQSTFCTFLFNLMQDLWCSYPIC